MSLKQFIFASIASILVFLSVTYAHFIFIGATGEEYAERNMGFPFTFYKEFWVNPPYPNFGWDLTYLMLDILITWIVILGVFYWLLKTKKIQV
jgi:hypothetical protein